MALGTAALVALLAAGGAVPPEKLQIAVLFDTGLSMRYEATTPNRDYDCKDKVELDVRAELIVFEGATAKMAKNVEYATAYCIPADLTSTRTVVIKPFRGHGSPAGYLEHVKSNPCAVTTDDVDELIDGLDWGVNADRRIAIIGRAGKVFRSGGASMEEVMHRAEREGIVVHVLEFVEPDKHFASNPWGAWEVVRDPAWAIKPLIDDVQRFLERPTVPLGRVPHHPRHATMISGGSYHLAFAGREKGETDELQKYRLMALKQRDPLLFRIREQLIRKEERANDNETKRLRDLLEAAYGRRTNSRDVLDDLAEGRLRPSEVDRALLPAALANVDLEPLLDAVWDFVDARRTLEGALSQLRQYRNGVGFEAGSAGAELGLAMRVPRKLTPSRR